MSLHSSALTELETWIAADADQERLRQDFVGLLADQEQAMWRSCYPDHLTAGALVIDATGERVLLNLHRKARRWFAFGGHAEPGDATLAEIAAREAREESGIEDLRLDPTPAQVDIHPVPFCDPRGEVRHFDVRFVAVAPTGTRVVVSDESLDVRWWPVTDLPELEPSMLALISRAIRG